MPNNNFRELVNTDTFGVFEDYITQLKDIAREAVDNALVNQTPLHIPDIYEICDKIPGLKDKLLKVYENNFLSTVKRPIQDIEEAVQIAQAACYETFMAAFPIDLNNTDTTTKAIEEAGKMETSDIMSIIKFNIPDDFKTKKNQTLKEANAFPKKDKNGNLKGNYANELYALKMNITDQSGYDTPVVDITKPTKQPKPHAKGELKGNYVLTPYIVVKRIVDYLNKLAQNKVLIITTEGYGTSKERVVTGVKMYLTAGNGLSSNSPAAKVVSYPEAGRIYIPILGVTGLSMRRERIDVHKITKIQATNDFGKYVKLAQATAGSPEEEMNDLQTECAIYGLVDFCKAYKKDPDNKDLQGMGNELGIGYATLTEGYIRDLSSAITRLHNTKSKAEKSEILASIKGLNKFVEMKKPLYGNAKLIDMKNMTDFNGMVANGNKLIPDSLKKDILVDMLRKGICRVERFTKNMKVQSVLCTLNDNILKECYGEDYKYKISSPRKKAYYIYKKLPQCKNPKEALELLEKLELKDLIPNNKMSETVKKLMTLAKAKTDQQDYTTAERQEMLDIINEVIEDEKTKMVLREPTEPNPLSVFPYELYKGTPNYLTTKSLQTTLNVDKIERVYQIQ